MKKTLVAVALMGLVGGVANTASAAEAFTPGTITTKNSVPTTFTYTVETDRADRLFVKNAFDFTLSTNVLMNADEDDPAGAFMAVVTGNTSGRNVFVGHSNGGSVGVCGDPLTATEAAVAGAMATEMGTRFLITDVTACTEDVDPS